MSLNAMSAVRIGALLVVAAGCAWGAGQYSDWRAFQRRNPDAIAICALLTPGIAIADAERRARANHDAMVASANGGLVVRIPGQSLCVVEVADGRVASASVVRND